MAFLFLEAASILPYFDITKARASSEVMCSNSHSLAFSDNLLTHEAGTSPGSDLELKPYKNSYLKSDQFYDISLLIQQIIDVQGPLH